jgi:hypothetical protein
LSRTDPGWMAIPWMAVPCVCACIILSVCLSARTATLRMRTLAARPRRRGGRREAGGGARCGGRIGDGASAALAPAASGGLALLPQAQPVRRRRRRWRRGALRGGGTAAALHPAGGLAGRGAAAERHRAHCRRGESRCARCARPEFDSEAPTPHRHPSPSAVACSDLEAAPALMESSPVLPALRGLQARRSRKARQRALILGARLAGVRLRAARDAFAAAAGCRGDVAEQGRLRRGAACALAPEQPPSRLPDRAAPGEEPCRDGGPRVAGRSTGTCGVAAARGAEEQQAHFPRTLVGC